MVDPSALRRTAAHVFVADLDAPELGERDAHHLGRVLRLRAGEEVGIADGAGGWRIGRWTGDGVEPAGPAVREPRPAVVVTIGFAVPKGDRAEWAVQKLTEVGADRVIALVAERSVVRWDAARAARQIDRWRAVAREAAMQSRRVFLPEILGPWSADAAAQAGPVALAEPGGDPPSLTRSTVLIGPEGGWSPQELELAPGRIGLGPRVLRTETAAVTAAVLLDALRGGIVRET